MSNELENAAKFKHWVSNVKNAGCTLHGVKPLAVLPRHNGEILFALLEAEVEPPEGGRLPEYLFLRGNACIVVPLLRNRSTGEERYLMVRQRRIGNGLMSLEFPAGMVDATVNDPRGVAIKELEEETGLSVEREALAPLVPYPLYSSPGGSDEAIHYFGCLVEMDNNEYRSFEGRIREHATENERITVTLRTRAEAENGLRSLQARLGFYLFQHYMLTDKKAE
ncbi:MAG: NUDIX domain-containing protein [Chitinivibrionales bacterium]|nr:NUDIX domain-containing protein [Chitinivibrionales bacterium]MBD3357546.1 NUDIX domain-containing protein [Chitinivibrionales bacterium]